MPSPTSRRYWGRSALGIAARRSSSGAMAAVTASQAASGAGVGEKNSLTAVHQERAAGAAVGAAGSGALALLAGAAG
ncbi:MAG: hypothetical protein FD126_3669, partial [Elusimicrobia bacterium]